MVPGTQPMPTESPAGSRQVPVSGWAKANVSGEVTFCFGPGGVKRGLKFCYGWGASLVMRIFWFRKTWELWGRRECHEFPF